MSHGSLLFKKWFPLIILRTVYHRCFIFHMPIGLGEGFTFIYCVFFRSKVKATKVTFVKKCFPLILLITIYHKVSICNVLIVLRENKTPFDVGFTRSKGKVTMVTFVK